MNKHITFAQFERVLTELGFSKKLVPQTGVAYLHPSTDTIVLVRLHKPNEAVPWHVLAAARVQLDGRGIIPAQDFEQMLETAAV